LVRFLDEQCLNDSFRAIVYPAAGNRLAIADVRVSSAPTAQHGERDASRETSG
jgi:hypothetical protein